MFYRRINESIELFLLELKHAPLVHETVDRCRLYLREWLPWVDSERRVEHAREYVRGMQHRMQENGTFDAGIRYRGEFVGVIGYHPIVWAHRSTAIGYWLAQEYQGRGIMTLACRAMLDHAFNDMGLNRIEIRAATANTHSRAIPTRLGLTHEGTLRQAEWLYDHFVDLEVYAMLRDDWGKRVATGG
jgi:ribosomal-protein-serine acetyltransferase